jgi:hypothetical protein
VLPLRPLAPTGDTASAGRRGRIRTLALTGLSLALLVALVGPSADLVVLTLAAIALASAAALARRNRGSASASPVAPVTPAAVLPPVDSEPLPPDVLTERLRRLYDEHVEQVNMALEEGREDLAQEMADSYMDEALGLLTGGGQRFPDHFSAR